MNADVKIRRVIKELRRVTDGDHDLLTVLMHVAAALFAEKVEREGKEEAKASLVDWFTKIANMADGKFDKNSDLS